MSKSFQCFLSHDCGTPESGYNTHKVVEGIHQHLLDVGIKSFFEVNDFKDGLTANSIAAISDSLTLVFFITDRFLDRANDMKTPMGMAFDTFVNNKEITMNNTIVVVLEPKVLDPATWKKSIVGDYLGYPNLIDMTTPGKMEKNMATLAMRIKRGF